MMRPGFSVVGALRQLDQSIFATKGPDEVGVGRGCVAAGAATVSTGCGATVSVGCGTAVSVGMAADSVGADEVTGAAAFVVGTAVGEIGVAGAVVGLTSGAVVGTAAGAVVGEAGSEAVHAVNPINNSPSRLTRNFMVSSP